MHCAVAPLPLCSFICSATLSVLLCSSTNLLTELSLVCEERDKLTQELKRTPELIEKSLTDLKEQCEHPYNLQHLIIKHYLFICWVSMFGNVYVSVYLCVSSSDESKLRQQQQELEQSWVEVRRAVAGREEAEQSLQQIQAQLEESKVNREEHSSELLSQQEHSERGEAAAVA